MQEAREVWSKVRDRPGKRPPAGWRAVARKEFADHLSSIRFVILIVVLGLLAIAAVYAAGSGIKESFERSSEFPALFLRLFTVSPERVPPFFALLAILGPLLGIAFGFDSINQERSQGTLSRLVAQPIYRDDIINGKYVAGLSVIALALGALTAIVAGVGLLRIGIVPSIGEVLRLLVWLLVSIIYIGFWLALSTWFSIIMRRAATSALTVLSVWLVVTLFGGFLVGIAADVVSPLPSQATIDEQIGNARTQQLLSRTLPGFLYQESTIALLNPDQQTFDVLSNLLLQVPESGALPSVLTLEQSLILVWPQVTALVALTVLCFAGAYISFMRQEVRA